MNRRLVFLTIIAVLASGYWLAFGEPESGQSESTARSDTYQAPDHFRVAFIDVASLFKRYSGFKDKMAEMKKKIDTASAQVQEYQKQMDDLKTKQSAPLESPVDKNLAQLNKLLWDGIAAQKSKFMQEEAVIYFETMQEVDRCIAASCRKHGINVVIRINNDAVDSKSRDDILRYINRPIL